MPSTTPQTTATTSREAELRALLAQAFVLHPLGENETVKATFEAGLARARQSSDPEKIYKAIESRFKLYIDYLKGPVGAK